MLHTWILLSAKLNNLVIVCQCHKHVPSTTFFTLSICTHWFTFVFAKVETYRSCCNACVQPRCLDYTNIWDQGSKCEIILSMLMSRVSNSLLLIFYITLPRYLLLFEILTLTYPCHSPYLSSQPEFELPNTNAPSTGAGGGASSAQVLTLTPSHFSTHFHSYFLFFQLHFSTPSASFSIPQPQ